MQQETLATSVIGKVKVEEMTPKLFKLTMIGVWWWYSGSHFARAVKKLSKTHKILTMTPLRGWQPSLLIVVE